MWTVEISNGHTKGTRWLEIEKSDFCNLRIATRQRTLLDEHKLKSRVIELNLFHVPDILNNLILTSGFTQLVWDWYTYRVSQEFV